MLTFVTLSHVKTVEKTYGNNRKRCIVLVNFLNLRTLYVVMYTQHIPASYRKYIVHCFETTIGCVFSINTLRPRQNGRQFPDDTFKCIFLNENIWISIKIPLNFVPTNPINNIPAVVQIMVWCRSGDKPLSKPIVAGLLTHICGLNELKFSNVSLEYF